MLKLILKIMLAVYNICAFVLLNVVMFFNHMWHPRRWEKVAPLRPPATVPPQLP